MKKFVVIYIYLILSIVASAQQHKKVTCVGNSITYGYGLPDRNTQSYPTQLQKMLGESYEVRNFGKSGATLLNKGHFPYIQQEEYREAIRNQLVNVWHVGL